VIIPGAGLEHDPETRRLGAAWLRKQMHGLWRVASVSTGLYFLAESGLIDHRGAVTHWRCAQDIGRRFPKVRVLQSAAFLKDGPFYSCGGGSAAMEMTLALIEEDYGTEVAGRVARDFVMRLRPAATEQALPEHARGEWESTERLADLPAWILAHLEHNLSVEVLAEKTCLCPRHFARLFKRLFRTTPADFVEQLRLGEAQRRLRAPKASIKTVAALVGFKSTEAFRRAFERELGVTPSSFRALNERARGPHPAVSAARSSARSAPLFSRK